MKIGLDRLNVDISREDINPIKSLYEAYVNANKDENLLPEAREVFARLESGEDVDGLSQWESIRKITIHNLESTYKRLGIKFDEYAWESWYNAKKIQPVIQRLKEEGLASEHNNHIVCNKKIYTFII
jgi:arginyl-tRNA synthetase